MWAGVRHTHNILAPTVHPSVQHSNSREKTSEEKRQGGGEGREGADGGLVNSSKGQDQGTRALAL